MRALVEWLSRLILRIFFRRIEIVGLDNVPANGPVILAVNHPNGLVDPLCILAHAPRKVSFLAKEPLFPLTWLAFSLALWWLASPRLAVIHLLLAPLFAWAALRFLDRAILTLAGARVLWLHWTQPARYAQLHGEGQAIAEQIVSVNLK